MQTDSRMLDKGEKTIAECSTRELCRQGAVQFVKSNRIIERYLNRKMVLKRPYRLRS